MLRFEYRMITKYIAKVNTNEPVILSNAKKSTN